MTKTETRPVNFFDLMFMCPKCRLLWPGARFIQTPHEIISEIEEMYIKNTKLDEIYQKPIKICDSCK